MLSVQYYLTRVGASEYNNSRTWLHALKPSIRSLVHGSSRCEIGVELPSNNLDFVSTLPTHARQSQISKAESSEYSCIRSHRSRRPSK